MKNTIYFLFAALVLSQCRSDVIEDFVPFGSQESAIRSLLQQASDTTAQTVFSLVSPTDATIELISKKGTRVFIENPDATFLDQSGQPIACSACQDLKITIKEANTERQMVALGLNLKASGLEVERTSGAIYLEVTCQGKPLSVAPTPDTKVVVQLLDPVVDTPYLYTAILDANLNQIDWAESVGERVFRFNRTGTSEMGYEFNVKKLGWNIGFLPIQGSKTTFCLKMDQKYNSENTFAYLLLDSERASILMPFDAQTGQFCLEGVPEGVAAQVMVVSKVGDQWHSVLKSTNTSVGQLTLDPKQTTDADVVETVKGL